MPAIESVTLNVDLTSTPETVTLYPDFVRKDDSAWKGDAATEIAKPTLLYNKRGPVKGQSELTKHSYRVTFPTLKSVVTDPGGPYEPTPALDYVSVAELTVWAHPRATATELTAAIAAVGYITASDFKGFVVDTIANGRSIY